ncbi:uncharacterized protein LOC111627141 [Centruroides sculpturatus]|uniref:uncharacterized protein LOC111627141 n=1 Tax=Centruroides sculpturatus TaxID=218467 RepID=UPI000C6DC6ED|nr:uncharacterized protein LOC111627141 [Centruroides sculpturatus]
MENQYQQGIIQIDNFQGPFDLLLALIKDKKLDIFEVNLVDVVNEYVKIIESLVNENVDLVSEYLVMAASLINLKARLLLKEPSENKKVAKQTQSLLTRLSIYQSFKNLATFLKEREGIGLKVLTKKTSDMSEFIKPVDPTRLDGQGNVI